MSENLGGDEHRYEIKFQFPLEEFSKIEQIIRSHYFSFKKFYQDRQVNNVYFDSFDLFSYEENLCGQAKRCKVRYRWYGETWKHDKAVLEFKFKDQNTTFKKRFELKEKLLMKGQKLKTFRDNIFSHRIVDLYAVDSAQFYPVLINQYKRCYWESADRLVRVTLDRDITFFDQTKFHSLNTNFSEKIGEVGVMEVKSAVENKALVEKIGQALPIKVSRFSKYVVGIQSASLI